MTEYTSAKSKEGYFWTISSAVAPFKKVAITVSRGIRVSPIRKIPWSSIWKGSISEVLFIVMMSLSCCRYFAIIKIAIIIVTIILYTTSFILWWLFRRGQPPYSPKMAGWVWVGEDFWCLKKWKTIRPRAQPFLNVFLSILLMKFPNDNTCCYHNIFEK